MNDKGKICSEAGFTLVELLVAITLLAAMTALLVAALQSLGPPIALFQRSTQQASVDAVHSFLRQVIAEARPLRVLGEDPQNARAFEGSADAARLVSSYVPAGQYAGLHVYDLELTPSGSVGSHDLVIRQSLVRPRAHVAAPEVRATILMRSVAGLRLRYFGAQGEQQAVAWSHDWTERAALPGLVSIDIVFAPGDRRNWPTMTVAPVLAGR